MQTQFHNYLRCLDEQRYFDAHEALEEIWFDKRFTKTPEVQLLKGLINAAVSFELYKRGKKAQSKKVWANYLKYRQFLYKITKYKQEFHSLTRYVEEINHKKHTIII
jgi:hypothetical protein